MTTTSATKSSIRELCERSHTISKEKGWLDGSARPVHLIVSLFQSELFEAFEDWRGNHRLDEVYYEQKGPENRVFSAKEVEAWDPRDRHQLKPCGIPIELADFVIRIAQHCGTENIDIEKAVLEMGDFVNRGNIESDYAKWMAWMNVTCSLIILSTSPAYSSAVHPVASNFVEGRQPTAENLLALLFLSTFAFADHHGIDLWSAINEKEAFNRTRPHRHGGKKA